MELTRYERCHRSPSHLHPGDPVRCTDLLRLAASPPGRPKGRSRFTNHGDDVRPAASERGGVKRNWHALYPARGGGSTGNGECSSRPTGRGPAPRPAVCLLPLSQSAVATERRQRELPCRPGRLVCPEPHSERPYSDLDRW